VNVAPLDAAVLRAEELEARAIGDQHGHQLVEEALDLHAQLRRALYDQDLAGATGTAGPLEGHLRDATQGVTLRAAGRETSQQGRRTQVVGR
jgi:hypothetical protein